MDMLTALSLQLSELLSSIDKKYIDCLVFSLNSQPNIRVNNSDQIDQFIQSLAQAAQSVKSVKIDPIKDGYYNPFLFYFVDQLLSISKFEGISLIIHFDGKRVTKKKIGELLLDTWRTYYYDKAREVAIYIVQSQLNDAKNKRNAQKAVDKHLNDIVIERINHSAKLIFRAYKKDLYNSISRKQP